MNKIRRIIKKILKGNKSNVIMLHSVDDLSDSCTISSVNFFKFVDCFLEKIQDGKIILTFDDGFESVYTKCFRYLLDRNIPFFCFVVSDFVDKPNYLSKQQIIEMLESGLLTIGSHGKTHSILNTISLDEAEKEIFQSKKDLEKIFGIRVSSFAYSHGVCDKNIVRLVKKAGYRFAYVATSNISDFIFSGNYRIPRYNLKEETVDGVIEELSTYEKKSV